jgi:polyketide synthase PksN
MKPKKGQKSADSFPRVSFMEVCERFPDKKLFTFPKQKGDPDFLTGKMLAEKTKILGSILQEKLAPQGKAILLLPQGMDYVCALMACFYANVTAIPTSIISPDQKEQISEKISPVLNNSQAACIITDSYFQEYLPNNGAFSSVLLLNIDEPASVDSPRLEVRTHSPEDLALLLYTSGSTSQPKGVMLTYRNLFAQALTGADQWGINQASQIVSWMPQFHNFGLHFGILAPLLQGASSVILSPGSFLKEPESWLKTINQYQATHTAAPNFAFDYLCSSIDTASVPEISLRSLQAIVCGGEPVRKETSENFFRQFQAWGLGQNVFCPHFGLSEVGSVTTKSADQPIRFLSLDIPSLEKGKIKFTNRKKKSKSVTSCGEIGAGTEVLIVHPETGAPCSAEEIGEILVKSISVGIGYYRQEEETRTTFAGGFLHTGDLGFIDDNQLYIVGREKEVIIIHGKNHHPVDIEWTIKKYLPGLTLPITVFSCEVNQQEKVVVVQELETLSEPEYLKLTQEILAAVSETHQLELYEIDLVAKGSIPKTGSGKVQRKVCRNFYLNQQLPVLYRYRQGPSGQKSKTPEPASAPNQRILVTLQREVFLPVLGVDLNLIEAAASFSELGLDSIQYVRVSRQIEEVFKIQFTPVMLFKHRSFERLAEYLGTQVELPPLEIAAPVKSRTVESDGFINLPNAGDREIAVIGISGHFPGGASDVESFWDNLVHQKDGITPISQSRTRILTDYQSYYGDLSDSFPQWGGFIDDVETFDAPFFGISPLEAESMDPQQRKLLELTWSVIENSGYTPSSLAGEKIGLFVGVHNNDYAELVARHPALMDTYGAFLDSGLHMSMIANRVSRWFNFHGPSEVINTACSSSLVAVHHGVESICRGECSLAIAGGINLVLTSRIYRASHKAGMLSPDGRCKTFDKSADGFVRAEGYGAVLLKPYRQAIKDRDPIYGIIKGAVINHDGQSNSLRAPNLDAQKELIKSAFLESGLSPETISYIEAHGTGTSLGDPIEFQALQEAFQEINPDLPHAFCGLGTVKTNIGHSESAAGIAGLIKVLLAMKRRILPGLLHFKNLNPYIQPQKSPFYIVEQNQEWLSPKDGTGDPIPRRAGISSFGFGGANAHVIVEEYLPATTAEQRAVLEDNPGAVIVPISAKNKDGLRTYARQLRAFLGKALAEEENPGGFSGKIDLPDLAYTLQIGREAMEERVIFLVKDIPELIQKLEALARDQASIIDCWQGRVKGKDLLTFLGSDEDAREMIGKWIAKSKLDKIAQYWVQGGTIDWNLLSGQREPRRINLPAYPFAKERYWIPESDTKFSGITRGTASAFIPVRVRMKGLRGYPLKKDQAARDEERSIQRTSCLLQKQWESCPAIPTRKAKLTVAILTTADTKKLAAELATHFTRSQIFDIHDLESPPQLPEQEWQNFDGWVDLAGCGKDNPELMGWMAWLQQLIEHGHKEGLMMLGVTKGLESCQNSTVNLAGAIQAGLYRMLQSEYGYIRSRHMDAEVPINNKALAELIAAEFLIESPDCEICYRKGKRYRAYLQEYQTRDEQNQSRVFPEGQVLWITGGTRGLGYLCAQHFVTHYGVKRLVLTGREVLPPRKKWDSDQQQGSSISRKIQAIRNLEAQGVQVQVLSVSLTDESAVRESLAAVKNTMGPVGGLIHCAGLDDAENPAFIRKSLDGMRRVFDPKVTGLELLYRNFKDEPLRFFVLFSSASAAIPALASGYSDYAMANAYMDYFAAAKIDTCPIVSIQWPSWKETGLGEVKSKTYEQTGLLSHTNTEGLQLLDRVLSGRIGPVVLSAVVNPSLWKPEQLMQRTICAGPAMNARTQPSVSGDAVKTPEMLLKETQKWLIQLFARELRMDPARIDLETVFPDYGVDSILLAQLLRSVNQLVKDDLDTSILLEYPSIGSFAVWLVRNYASAISKAFGTPVSEPSGSQTTSATDFRSFVSLQRQRTARELQKRAGFYRGAGTSEIAVIGFSCRFPGAGTAEEYWRLLAEGQSAIGPVPQGRWGYAACNRANNFYAGLLDKITSFDPSVFMIAEEDARAMDPQALVLLEECFKLWSQAGYSSQEMKGQPVGVYIGARSQYQPGDPGFRQARNPVMASGQNYMAANISKFFDLRGPSLVVDTACSSALVGMKMAVQSLSGGEIASAVVGGVNLLTSDQTHRLFAQRGILSQGPSFHIFDRRAAGLVLGEGVGLVLLKTVDQALKDGDSIYAVIKGIAVNNDGRTAGPATPNLQAQKEVMQTALAKSDRKAEEISYIEANGSGTEVTDLLELKALQAVYRSSRTEPLSLGSMKPNIGHPLCAEGMAGFIKVLLMLKYQKLVPFLSGEQPMAHYDLASSPFYFCRELTEWGEKPRVAAINCFADGGTNAHVILEAWEEPGQREVRGGPVGVKVAELPSQNNRDMMGKVSWWGR